MIRIKKLEKDAYKIEISGDPELLAEEYITLTEYLSRRIPEVLLVATEHIAKKLEG